MFSLHYDGVSFPGVSTRSSNDKYLETVRVQILAEYNAFLGQAQPAPIKLVTGSTKRLPVPGKKGEELVQISVTAFWKEGPKEEDLSSLNSHLVVYGGHFYKVETKDLSVFLVGPGDRYVYDGPLPRARDDKDMPARFSTPEGRDAHDLGYIGDALSEHRCCSDLIKLPSNERPTLLSSISDPLKRRVVKYSRGMFILTLSHRMIYMHHT
jgi:hypothetical protein